MVFNFEVISSEKIGIGHQDKMGSSSIKWIMKLDGFHKKIKCEDDFPVVVLIRDIQDRWKSGYKEELPYQFTPFTNILDYTNIRIKFFVNRIDKSNDIPFYKTFTDGDDVTKEALNKMAELHDVDSDISWMWKSHCNFWEWNSVSNESLLELALRENIYFMDLKNLSNPKFLEWLQEKDETWKDIDEIPHHNKTRKNFWPQMELFWEEYKEGKILKDRNLFNPSQFWTWPFRNEWLDIPLSFDLLNKLMKREQRSVDYIRNSHPRYLDF